MEKTSSAGMFTFTHQKPKIGGTKSIISSEQIITHITKNTAR